MHHFRGILLLAIPGWSYNRKKASEEKRSLSITAILTLVDGRKGIGDTLVLVTSYESALSFGEWLYIGKNYLDSEDSYYPIAEGYIGKAMLLNALNELACGVSFEKVLQRYNLQRKSGLTIVDKRKKAGQPRRIERSLEARNEQF